MEPMLAISVIVVAFVVSAIVFEPRFESWIRGVVQQCGEWMGVL